MSAVQRWVAGAGRRSTVLVFLCFGAATLSGLNVAFNYAAWDQGAADQTRSMPTIAAFSLAG